MAMEGNDLAQIQPQVQKRARWIFKHWREFVSGEAHRFWAGSIG